MKNEVTDLAPYVATAVANDYESFDSILQDVERLLAEEGLLSDQPAILKTLERLVANGYVKAYTLPDQTEVPFSPDKLNELWFYATPQGKRLANGEPQLG